MELRRIYFTKILLLGLPLLLGLSSVGYAQCVGGMVSTPSGDTVRYTCPGDGNADVISFVNTSTAATSYAYVITDDQNNILGTPPTNSQDFEGAGTGTCRVWGLSYTGTLTVSAGQNATSAALATGCFDLSSNFIEIVRDNPSGDSVFMPSGATRRYTCPGDGNPDVVSFVNTSTSQAQYAYVITDDQNVILGVPPGNMQDFEGAGSGVCRVWGLSYTGQLTAMQGQNAVTASLSSDCFELSDNFIEIVRDNPSGDSVFMPSGATVRYTCPGDGNADLVSFVNTSSSQAQYAYVITDDQNVILGVPPGNMQDFEGAGTGVCRVWGLSYTGQLTAMQGQNAVTASLSSDCFELSDNFIEIVRDNPSGDSVFMPSGATRRYTCPGDGNPDLVSFVNTSSSQAQYAYVITDDQNVILGVPPGNMQDFEGAGTGVCRVWGLSYTGQLTAMQGQNAVTASLSSDCFELSDNFIEIVRDNPSGDSVFMPSGATVRYTCPGDGNADLVSFVNTSSSQAQYAYVITDDQNVILGVPPGNMQDFEGAGSGVCRVWGLSYTGQLTAMQGQNAVTASLSSDCFELSDNFIEIVRDNPSGDSVFMPSGATVRYTCPGDGNADLVSFVNTSSSQAQYAYVITDDQNVILGVPPGNMQDFEGAGSGVCRVWGLSYTGQLTAMQGQNAVTASLSSDCFELSDNFIEIVRDNPSGDSVFMPSGATVRYTCPGDGNADLVSFVNTSSSQAQYAYVITDDQNVILGVPPGNMQDFEGAGSGVCRVWGLSYTGQLTAMQGQNAVTASLSSDCFELSDNFIEIVRVIPDGGVVSSSDGNTQERICINGNADPISFVTTSTALGEYQYIVTDDNGTILAVPPVTTINFDGAGPGICRVYGLSYVGTLSATPGQNISTASSSDCFELSSNWLEIVREADCQVEVCAAEDFQPGNANAFAVLLDGIAGAPANTYSFENNSGTLTTYDDGTANLTGTIAMQGHSTYKWEVDVWFINRRNWTGWSALGRTYKGGFAAAIQNHPNWDYYEFDITQASLTGVPGSQFAGDTINLSPHNGNTNLGFQKGVGANDKNGNVGASTWFDFAGSYSGFGDFNLTLRCNSVPGMIAPIVQLQTSPGTPISDSLGRFLGAASTSALTYRVARENTLTGKGGAPEHGTLNLQQNGQFLYTPQAGFTGQDGFRYRAFGNANTSAFVEGAVDIQVGNGSLPVTWVSFIARIHNETEVALEWVTANEAGNAHFVVEKSSDLEHFASLGEVAAQQREGPLTYRYIDGSAMTTRNFFRLKQVDQDGNYTYSSVVEVHFGEEIANPFELFPNPTTDILHLELPTGNYGVQVIDMSGRVLHTQPASFESAQRQQHVNVSNLSPGVYLLSVTDEQGVSRLRRFVKR